MKPFPRVRINVRSVFVKCAGLMTLTTIVVGAGMAFMASSTVDQLARKGVVEQAARLAPPQAEALTAPLRFGIEAKIAEIVEGTLATAGASGHGALALGADGTPLALAGAESVQPDLVELGRAALASGAAETARNGLWRAEPVRAEPGAEALGAVVIAMSDEQALAAVRSDKLLVLAVALGLFAVMTAGTLVVLGRLLGRPLETLGGAVNRLEQGDYDTPVPMAGRQDELGAIARDLDRLAAVLRKGREGEAQREAQHEAQVKVVNSLGAGLDALARGVLTTRLAETFPGDYEALRDNFNRAVTSLAEAIAAVQGNAHSISNGANEIAQSSDDLSRRTETQAATLEQTAAALEELLASVRSAAQNAEDADTAVGEARDMANRNDDVMRSAMKAMAEIERSSEQIGEIITVIDDIAFQTNLLALNAGVEAARAGSSGKGFAVVASEVRALAQRSSDAARQIKDLISGSTDQVKQGARLVEEAGAALEQVVNRVSAVSDLVSGIAAGASEQSQGLNEINVGVANLDQVTQQNAAMVEQSTAAAHMLRGEAAELTALVARFEIDEGPGVNDGRDSAGGQVSAA